MARFSPNRGVNFRLPAYETPLDQALLMQNVDFTREEIFEQIDGFAKFHGTSLGTNPAWAIIVHKDNEKNITHILAAVDDKIVRKNEGTNEFDTLITGLTPNLITSYVTVAGKTYIAHPKDGLFEYDGIGKIVKVNSVLLSDIIFSKETNRAFGISSENPNAYFWTDDVSTTGGAPLLWPGANSDTIPSTKGDKIEKLGFLSGRLVFFCTNSTWIEYVNGPSTNWRPEQSPTVIGWVAPKTIKRVRDGYWGLGNSDETGIGLYEFTGETANLLTYDIRPYLERINPIKLKDSCAEYVNNLYKLSLSIDSSLENDKTLHFDVLRFNEDSNQPNIYGPHTYGFNASAVVDGSHILSQTYQSGSWIFKVGKFKTFHGTGIEDNGDLIPVIMLSGIRMREELKDGVLDETWFKRYGNFYLTNPPRGTWNALVEILRDYQNETYTSWNHYLDSDSYSLENINLGQTPLDLSQFSTRPYTKNIGTTGIQIKLSNLDVGEKFVFASLIYDVRAVRKLKEAQRVEIL